ncbi:MAG: hypothetical protein JWR63_1023 [Conexibacter sp.]|nr:hypothetical protein [Conexibacter sp.]
MATDYAGFLATVEREAHVPRDEAEGAVSATLETLGERISGGEARDLAERLPAQLAELVVRHADDGPQPLSAREFLKRVQIRELVPIDAAEAHVRAVFAALRRTVGPDEIADLASELPRDLERLLFDDPPPPDELGEDEDFDFVDRVARRTALDAEGARRATETVLEMLAFRLSAGEAEDLAAHLPEDLRAAVRRGTAEKRSPEADWLPLKQFLIAIAEREGVPRSAARLHARAVLETLAEAVGDEIDDVAAQLPAEYRSLFPRP